MGHPIILTRTVIPTPVGEMTAITSERGIVLFDFSDNAHLPSEIKALHPYFPKNDTVITDGEHPFLLQLKTEIREYFAGTRQTFEIPLHPVGTDFQIEVWTALQKIPYGLTCSYGEEAALMGRPKSVRAVANANGRNKLPILIPCHRVIGSDGTLTGYSGGIDRKTALLDLERRFSCGK